MIQCSLCKKSKRSDGYKMCPKCRRAERERKAGGGGNGLSYHQANAERINAQSKAKRDERLSAGLCTRCGRFPLDKPGCVTCIDCREDKKEYMERPEVRAHRQAYMKEYESRPRVKAYRESRKPANRAYNRAYYGTDRYWAAMAGRYAKERTNEKS